MKKVFVILIGLFLTLNVFGQEIMSGISYNMGLPTSMTRNFIQNYSWRGFGFEVRDFRGDNLSVGGSFSWNIFAEKTDKVIYLENGAASGTQVRSLNVFPLMLNGHYYFGTSDALRPYLGLNVGTYYIRQRLEIGVIAPEDSHWHFGLAPEFGVMLPTYSGTIFFLNARYNYAFKAGKDLKGEGKDWAYWGFNVGLSFSYNAW
jgi:opacity protein-like surface antigen